MASEEKYIASLRKHLFKTPNPGVGVGIFLVVLTLAIISLHISYRDSEFLFAIPFFAAICADYLTIKFLEIYFPPSRIVSLNVLAFIIAMIMFLISLIFFPFYMAFYLGFSTMIDIRYVVYRAFFGEKKRYSILTSTYYNVAVFAVSLLYPGFPPIPYILASIAFLIAGYAYISTTTAPFVEQYNTDPLMFISSFVNYLGEFKKEDEHRINNFFFEMYEYREVPVTTLVFRNEKGVKAAFVAPYMHPGPFGTIGGSDIPNKLEKMTGEGSLMVFHTTTTHDNNIANDEDVKRIAEVVKKALNEKCKYDTMSDLHRFKIGEVSAAMQVFGNYAFVALIPEKADFDDVELETGLAIIEKLNNVYEEVMPIDAHNCFDEGATPLQIPKENIYFEKVLKEMQANKKIRMGFYRVDFSGKSIGPGGIRAAVFEYGSKKIAYILIDGNNIKKGLRDRIRSEVEADEVEIFSTDNHVVNISMVDLNPVGQRDSWDDIVNACKEAVKNAVDNMEDVCVYASTEKVKLRMASRGNMKKIATITKEGVKRATIMAPVLLASGYIISAILFYLLQ